VSLAGAKLSLAGVIVDVVEHKWVLVGGIESCWGGFIKFYTGSYTRSNDFVTSSCRDGSTLLAVADTGREPPSQR
jgi:hypothetical protein